MTNILKTVGMTLVVQSPSNNTDELLINANDLPNRKKNNNQDELSIPTSKMNAILKFKSNTNTNTNTNSQGFLFQVNKDHLDLVKYFCYLLESKSEGSVAHYHNVQFTTHIYPQTTDAKHLLFSIHTTKHYDQDILQLASSIYTFAHFLTQSQTSNYQSFVTLYNLNYHYLPRQLHLNEAPIQSPFNPKLFNSMLQAIKSAVLILIPNQGYQYDPSLPNIKDL